MSISAKMISDSMNESSYDSIDAQLDNFLEESGFDGFGVIKTSLPTTDGLDAAMDTNDEFVDAIDSPYNNTSLSFHDSFPNESYTGFEEDANYGLESFDEECNECIDVDPNTIVPHPDEADQWESEDDLIYGGSISDEELASDDRIDESSTGFDDLF